MLARTRLRHSTVSLSKDRRWGDVRDRRLQLVVPAAHHITVATHHDVETHSRDIGRIVLLGLSHLCIQHVGPFEEIGLDRPGHQTRHGYTGVLQFGSQCKRDESMNVLVALYTAW